MKTVRGKTTHHFGLVSDVFAEEIESLDGNSGDWSDARTDWTTPYVAESEVAWSPSTQEESKKYRVFTN